MPIFYTDTTNKYDTSTIGIETSSVNFGTKLNNTLGSITGFVIDTLQTILPFESLTRLKNERLQNEQNSNISADQIQANADQKMMFGVVALVVAVVIAIIIIRKRS